jgi:nucleoside-diphosphate-sugar epimerase
MPVQGRKFVIVGGAGLVGSAVAHAVLGDHGADVVICDRLGSVNDRKWANLPPSLDDLWTPDSLLSNLDKNWREIAGVVVLADDGHLQQDCDAMFEAAYHLPRRIWDFCVAKQRPMAWASSAHIYGAGPSHLSTKAEEIVTLKPSTAFGHAKLAFDMFAARQGTGPDTPPVWTGLRLSSVYGPSEIHKGVQASLPVRAMAAARAGTTLDLWNDSATGNRDWVHADDAGAAIAALIAGQHAGFFDVGTGQTLMTDELIACVENVAAKKLRVGYDVQDSICSPSLTPANIRPLAEAGLSVQFRSLHEGLTTL